MAIKTCPICNSTFSVAPSEKQTCCSRQCSGVLQAARAKARRSATGLPTPVARPPAPVPPVMKRIGRPPRRDWPERDCIACKTPYRGRNKSYCSDACRMSHTKEALPPFADLVRPHVGYKTYREIAALVEKETGRKFGTAQVTRIVAKLRAKDTAERLAAERASDELLQAERARCDALRAKALNPAPVPAQIEASKFSRITHTTKSGLTVTLLATSRPQVTDDEVRVGSALWHGSQRGLAPPEEKPRRKRKAPRALVQPAGREG